MIGTAVAGLASPTVARYGDRTIPMDDALVQAVLDVGGRAFYEGPLPSRLYDHWMRSFSDHARATLHLRVLRGPDRHHVVEAAFKSLGLALRDALAEGDGVFSTKGAVSRRRSVPAPDRHRDASSPRHRLPRCRRRTRGQRRPVPVAPPCSATPPTGRGYEQAGADEMVLLDISASADGRETHGRRCAGRRSDCSSR